MPKLSSNAVLNNCFQCPEREMSEINYNRIVCSLLGDFLDEHIVNPDTIDKNCPFQDCEVVDRFWDDTVTGQKQFITLDSGYYAKDIDYIIIVKKKGAEG